MKVKLYRKPVEFFGRYKVNVVEIHRSLDKNLYVDYNISIPATSMKFIADDEVEIKDEIFSEISENADQFYVNL